MHGDYTRNTFDPARHYSGVRLQQGRVQLDADWNEQVDITTHRDETTTHDVVGPRGAPLHDAGFAITVSGGDLEIGAGRYYVDGVLCQNEAAVLFTQQPDLPGATLAGLSAGTYLAYLDVWQRHLTALEEPRLREVALGGPDTATRTRTVWQVKLESVATNATCDNFGAGWQPADTASTGKLRAQADPAPAVTDECMVPPGGGYRRLENQLYRVEIHAAGAPGSATYKWSRDNGTLVSRLTDIVGNVISIDDPGRDPVLTFADAPYVELTDEGRILRGEPGVLVEIASTEGNTLTVQSWPGGTALTMADFGDLPVARRWDGTATVTTGAFVELEDGVQVEFDSGDYRAGDYWLIPARSLTGSVEWPNDSSGPLFEPRHGTTHHYGPLALLDLNNGAWTVRSDCRALFPPTTELVSLFYVGGDGQEGQPGQPLPQALEAGVARGQHPVVGATVQFTILTGSGTLQAGSASGATVPAVTNAQGIAACTWQLDSGTQVQRVEAKLADGTHLPIHFTATLTQAASEPGVRIKDVRLIATNATLPNDSNVSIPLLLKGIEVECDSAIEPASISRPTCYLTLELPFLAGRATETGVAAAAGYFLLNIGANVQARENIIEWQPNGAAATWMQQQLPEMIRGEERVLARLTLKGNFIWDRKDPDRYLDGEAFGVRAPTATHTAIRFPTGERRRGGDFEMWFWLAPGGTRAGHIGLITSAKGRVVSDARIRQALSFAIDREKLQQVLPQDYQLSGLPFDPNQARKLAREAGAGQVPITAIVVDQYAAAARETFRMIREVTDIPIEVMLTVGKADLVTVVAQRVGQGLDVIFGDEEDSRRLERELANLGVFDGGIIPL